MLGLQDWAIRLKLRTPDELNSALGDCTTNPDRRIATVSVRISETMPEHEDMEATIVHELLHLYFGKDSDQEDAYQTVRMEGRVVS